jgi:type IV pilus assembly protein PilX
MIMMQVPHKQRGAVLIVSLIILLLLTLLSVSAGRDALMQERMTFATRDGHVALENAEMGLKHAEAFLDGIIGTSAFVAAGTNGLYSADNGPVDITDNTVWAAGVTRQAAASPMGGVTPALYFIEEIGELDASGLTGDINLTNYGETSGSGTVNGFRITVRGTGQSAATQRFIVSFYGARI